MACCVADRISVPDVKSEIQSQGQRIDAQLGAMNDKIKTIETTMCLWAQPEVTDQGEDFWSTFWKAALLAVSLINAAAQTAIANKRYQIAKDYANIATDQWSRFRDAYAPLERAMLNEISNTPEPVPDYAGAKYRGNSKAQRGYKEAGTEMTDLAGKYALCVDPSFIEDMDIARALSADDGVNYDYRDEEHFALQMSDLRWNRRSNLLNLGRGIQATSASYASAANNMLAQLSNLAGQTAQGAMQLFGYLSEHRNTMYPSLFSGTTFTTGGVGDGVVQMGPMAQ